MRTLDQAIPLRAVGEHISIISGKLDLTKLTLFSTFRDETFFCSLFFDHYRKLGVEQFLIIDDHSIDGTSEFLFNQSDCVVLQSQMTYGQKINIENNDGKVSEGRAGIYFKQAVPSHFLKDSFVLYLDADEFLFLPPGCKTLQELVNRMKLENASNLVASIVEFFPEKISDLEIPVSPTDLASLLSAYPYFQFEQLIDLADNGDIIAVNDSKTTQLFKQHRLVFKVAKRKKRPSFFQSLKALSLGRNPRLYNAYRKSPRFKTPLLHVRDDSYFTGTHEGNQPCSQNMMPTIAHFVYTHQLPAKIERAREWRSYARNSLKYDFMTKLIRKMRAENSSFLDEKSVRFESVDQFLECGLMRESK